MLGNKKYNDYGTGIPEYEIEALALTLWPALKEYMESEQGQREFATWKAEQEKSKRTQKGT